MSAYWVGFWQGALVGAGALTGLGVIVALALARRLRERDGVEP